VIENTIAKMDSVLIACFVNKIIDILQSNIYYRKNIIPWIKLIFEKHFAIILNLPLRTIENFNIIKQLISNRTQYKEKLEYLHAKLKFINDYYQEISKNKPIEIEENKEYTPLLIYYESDDEETLMKNKGKFCFLFLNF
jgi:cell shape-determining protein MreC